MKENLEQQILAVAEELFIANGFDGTSTTIIAQKVGCNQALIHYYFRTKENLFQQIFVRKFEATITHLLEPLTSELPFIEKITNCINIYFDLLQDNRQLPTCIINELAFNPQRREFIRNRFIKSPIRQEAYYRYYETIGNEIRQGNIRPIEPFGLILNIISLCLFTFITLPIYTDLLERTPEQVNDYINHRRQEIITQIITSLYT
jgi:AcrR family transcriptional regulator